MDTSVALWKMEHETWKLNMTKRIKCFMVQEPFMRQTGLATYTSAFFFHMASTFEATMNRITEAGIFNELTKIYIWQKTELPKKPWEKDGNAFIPAGLNEESKIPVIFLLYIFGIGIAALCFFGEFLFTRKIIYRRYGIYRVKPLRNVVENAVVKKDSFLTISTLVVKPYQE